MSRPISAYGLSLVLLRLIGLVLIGAWLYDWLLELFDLVQQLVAGSWGYFQQMLKYSLIPKPFRMESFWEPSNTNAMLKLGLGLYLLLGGKLIARLLARNTDPLGCPNCGYSLRGLKSDHCPECGNPVAKELHRASASEANA
jgi:hypothetical protein